MLLLAAGTSIPTAQTQAGTILVLGDSISAAYGMDLERGWVALLQHQLSEQQSGWRVVNASISGDTSAGGLQRLPTLIERHQPDIVIVELGGNDGLRGYPIAKLRSNLTQMIEISRSQGAGVLLLAMYPAPPAADAAKRKGDPKLAFDNAGTYWSAASPCKRRAASPARVAAKSKRG